MADQSISQLNLLADAALSPSDELPIVDVSASETKRIKASAFINLSTSGITDGSLDIIKLNQNSTTKLGSAAIADSGITVSKLADNSSIVSASTAPNVNNFAGKGWLRSADRNLFIYADGEYRQVVTSSSGIADGAVLDTKLATGAVTDAKIQAGGLSSSSIGAGVITNVKLADSGITTVKVADEAITNAKIAPSTIDGTRLAVGAVGTSALADSGITSSKLAAGAIDTAAIADGAIANAKIANTTVAYAKLNLADGDIPGAKIASASISGLQLAASAVATAAIADSAVTSAKIADSGVTSGKIGASAVTTDTIAANAVTAVKLGSEAVGTSALATSGITSSKFAAGAVNTAALGTGAVTNEKITDATIAYAKLNLADGSVPGTKITSSTISGLQISTGGVLSANIADGAITNAKIASTTIGAGKFAAGAIATADLADDAITNAKLADNAVGTAQIADSGVTASKLANSSSTIVQSNAPTTNGAFTGQQFLDTSTGYEYTWNGASWQRQSAINDIVFNASSPLSFSVAYPDEYSATITASVSNQSAASVFAGPPSGSSAAPSFRALQGGDLPLATSGTVGAVLPGAGLQMGAPGVLQHINSTIAGTYVGAITIDSEGHIVAAANTLSAEEIPNLDASKITTGTFSSAFLANNSVTAAQLSDYGIAQVSESAPTPEFAGQWWINPNDRAAYIWVGVVAPTPEGYWLNLGYGSPTQINLRFGGTYNASGNVVTSINSYGIEAGLSIGQPLSAPSTSNNGVYLIVTTAGTGTNPAPTQALSIGNWVLSEGVGNSWTKVDLGSSVGGISDQDVLVNGPSLVPAASGIANQEGFNTNVWAKVQIATTLTAGIVRGSTEILVASGTGILSLGDIDDGSY
jgi:hypothetical protein